MKIQRIENNSVYSNNKKLAFKRAWSEHISWGANYFAKTGKTNFKLFSFPDAKAVLLETTKKASILMTNMWEHFVNIKAPEKLAGATTAGAIAAISTLDDDTKLQPMENKGNGIFVAKDVDVKPGDGYRFVIVKNNGEVSAVKDPYAKKQPNIHGWSEVYNQNEYEWKNTDWLEGKDPRRIVRKPDKPLRGLENLIIDEINIPTQSKQGTFEAAKANLDKIAKRGVATAVEIMPVENTYSLQWGYDGVDKFAVNEKMGGPNGLKDYIDYAHQKGLNVIMDMVPNHIGPNGNDVSVTGPYKKCEGEFGDKFNYEGQHNHYVRDWMTNAALWWANEFKVDGIRFDLTGATDSDWLLRQIALELNEHNPDVFLIAEDHQHKRHAITGYEKANPNITHEENIFYVDAQVEAIANGFPGANPRNIGFDSEWDSDYKENLSQILLTPNTYLLDKFDHFLQHSHYRIHYAYSHDEYGNEDGTKFIPKYIVRELNLFEKTEGCDDAEKGQKAAHAAQKLSELIVSKDFANLTDEELLKEEQQIGLKCFLPKQTLTDAFNTAIAKQKLMLGIIYTTPGPKMFFQGDDIADFTYFKFFREFSDDKQQRENNPNKINKTIQQKGYDTLEEIARPDSIVGKVKPNGMYKNVTKQMENFMSDLRKIFDENPAMRTGEIQTYKDNNHIVHSHKLVEGDNEILIIKNFGYGFHNGNYEYFGFPNDGSKWEEIFSSDDTKYGGGGYTNKGRKDINNLNQNLNLAPNSFIILKRIND